MRKTIQEVLDHLEGPTKLNQPVDTVLIYVLDGEKCIPVTRAMLTGGGGGGIDPDSAREITAQETRDAVRALLTGTLNVQPAAPPPTSSALTIPAGSSLSNGLDLAGRSVVRIDIGSAWTAADITVQVSADGQGWLDLYDEYGTPYTIKAAAHRAIYIPPGPLLAANWIRFRSGTPSAPVNQSADATIRLLSVPL